jgi:hypothetical protein
MPAKIIGLWLDEGASGEFGEDIEPLDPSRILHLEGRHILKMAFFKTANKSESGKCWAAALGGLLRG